MIMRSRERKELAKLREEAEMLVISDEELESIEEISEAVNNPERAEERSLRSRLSHTKNSDASVEEEIEDELEKISDFTIT